MSILNFIENNSQLVTVSSTINLIGLTRMIIDTNRGMVEAFRLSSMISFDYLVMHFLNAPS